MFSEKLSSLAGARHTRIVVCLLVVLVSTHIDQASAQAGIDWHKSSPPPVEETNPFAHVTARAATGIFTVLEETIILLPLVIGSVEADLPPIRNGDFELGGNGDWHESWVQVDYIITSWDLPLTPHSGEWIAWLGGVDNEVNRLSQSIVLPPGQSAYLHFYYQTNSVETACNNDVANLTVNQDVLHTFTLCAPTNTSEWLPVSLDLTSYSGQMTDISFNYQSNASLWSSVVIDDVSISPTP